MANKSNEGYTNGVEGASSPADDPVNSSPKIEEEKIATSKSESRSWREHSNPVVRFLAKTGFTVWLIVMAVGVGLAFLVAFIAV